MVKYNRTHEEQMARVCEFEGCEVSLAYATNNKKWCDDHSETARRQNINRVRRQRKNATKPEYYQPDLPDSIEIDDTTVILYEDYKEPLRRVPKGYGYLGTVAMTENREYIQCHECGDLFKRLNGHTNKVHGLTMPEYRKKYGLSKSTALVGDSERYKLQQYILKETKLRKPGELPKHLKEYAKSIKESGRSFPSRKDYSLEWRNKRGLCPDQVLEKILDLKVKLGRIPSYDEFSDEYDGRYLSSIKYLHGSWTEAVKKIGEKTREDLRRHSEEDLIAELQDFQKRYNRIPMTSDFNRGMLTNKGTFIRKFGTLNNARIAAGMNAIVPTGGGRYGKYKEISAEEYFKYLEGHGISDNAKRLRERRRNKSWHLNPTT